MQNNAKFLLKAAFVTATLFLGMIFSSSPIVQAHALSQKFVPAIQLSHIKFKRHYVSPDSLYYAVFNLPVETSTGSTDVAILTNTQPPRPVGIWYHTTAILWLPNHGHIFIGSGDYNSGPDEIDLGCDIGHLDNESKLDPLTIPALAKYGCQLLYGASADGKTLIYGCSEHCNPHELQRHRSYKLPAVITGNPNQFL